MNTTNRLPALKKLTVICATILSGTNTVNANALGSLAVQPTQMVQGGTGLLQTPTSRMAEEGNLSLNYTDNEEYRFWTVSLQLFDWMEATARYTDVRTQLYSEFESFSGDQTLKDKGLDVKFRLWQESYYLPQIAVGFRDIGGTGFFESEYVTASKRVGPLDFHLGLGWGYLGTHNDFTSPLCELKEAFCTRPQGYSGEGGQVDYNQFFRGPMAVFGGIEYQTPWQPLTLKLEYEGNNYVNDRAGELVQDSRWNLGAVYNWGNFDFSLNYQRGNTLGFGVSYRLNMHNAKQIKFDAPPRDITTVTPPQNMQDVNKQRMVKDLGSQAGFSTASMFLNRDQVILFGGQLAYRDNDEALERTGRILASELPDSVKTYHILEGYNQNVLVESIIDADKFKQSARYEVPEPDVTQAFSRQAPSADTLAKYQPVDVKGFFYGVNFFWVQTFGSPEDFYLYQGGLNFSTGYKFSSDFGVYSGIRTTLLTNFDKFNFKVDNEVSPVPRVRTMVREYVTGSDVYLDTLFLNYEKQLSQNVFAQAYGGYLENMYGGVGAEVMYREVDSNIAYGFDINYVKQRDYDDYLGFLDYTAVTGFASVYWQPKWLKEARLAISAGQFLAKDKGVNIDFAKRFDSGIVVGAFAAFSDVSAEDYGEGSFTKGFYISIPMDLFVLKPAKGRGTFPWVPIARDGGQMLRRPSSLIDKTEIRSPFYD